jgi:hypothetical protein
MLVVSAVPSLLLLVVGVFFVPESPRFLLVHGDVEGAKALLQKAADWNHTKVDLERSLDGKELCLESSSGLCDVSSPAPYAATEVDSRSVDSVGIERLEPAVQQADPTTQWTLSAQRNPSKAKGTEPTVYTMLCDMSWDVELGPELLAVTHTLCALFFLMAFVYYALILLTVALVKVGARERADASGIEAKCKPLDDNEYVSIVWANAGEIPGLFIAALLLDSIGRKRTIAALFSVAGAIFVILALDLDGLSHTLNLGLVFCARAASLGFNQSLWVRTFENTCSRHTCTWVCAPHLHLRLRTALVFA